jgi:hydroxymethylpyrimidine pyrophosphatase-like HAD family hydrolase
MHSVSQIPQIRSNKPGTDRHSFTAVACDADGTLTWRKQLAGRTAAALVRWRSAGGQVILVTGEVRADLLHLARTGLFDRIVGENGGTLLRPPGWRAHALGPPPPPGLVRALRGRVRDLTVGRVMVATQQPDGDVLRVAIRDLGVGYRVIRNLKNLMALPAGVNKTSGLRAALDDLGLDAARVVSVGNGENDVCLAGASGLCVAVADAVPEMKARADWVTRRRGPDGVIEVIRRLLKTRAAKRRRSRSS